MGRPTVGGLSRAVWIVAGLAALAWIGLEDRGLNAVTALGWVIAVAGLLSVRHRRARPGAERRTGVVWWLLAGAATGVSVAPIGATLILIKVGLHAHPVADFAVADIAALASRAAVWAAAGAVLGLGAALVERSRRP